MKGENNKGEDSVEANNMLYGAQEVAAFMGIPRRRLYYLAGRHQIPVFKMGAVLCARKSTLRDWISLQEQKGISANG